METSRDDFAITLRSAFLKKETKQKFSLLALILLSLLLITIESLDLKYLNYVRFIVKDGIYRAAVIASTPEKYFNDFSQTIGDHFVIYEENKTLKKEIQKLNNLNFELKYLKTENNLLSSLLSEEVSSDFKLLSTKVILDNQSPFLKSFIIDKGKNNEIEKGMAVLSNGILIGRVIEASYFSSRVLLLDDLNSKIPVIIEPEGHHAILSGKGDADPHLEFLPKNHDLVNGNIVYTSGKDGVLFSGIPIGKILVDNEIIKVDLIYNLDQLLHVHVVLNYYKEKI